MTKCFAREVSMTAVIALCVAGPACAQGQGQQHSQWSQNAVDHSQPGGFDDDGGQRSRTMAADAVRRAQAESGGRVLGAERVQFDGRDIMRVKVMDENGRVRYMDDDPMSSGGRQADGGRHDGRNDMQSSRPRGANPPRP